jgi:hypothetical protein
MRTNALRLLGSLTLLALFGCAKEAPPPAPSAPSEPPAAQAEAPAAPAGTPGEGAAEADTGTDGGRKSKLGPAPTDGLSLAERIERRKAEEAKLAAQLADEERKRLLAYDRGKLPQHQQVFAFIKATRAEYEKAGSELAVEKVRLKMEKATPPIAKKLQSIDPKGGNSNVVTDYDVMLNLLAGDYPDALKGSLTGGDKQALAEYAAELDRRTQKVDAWLKELKKK